MLKFGRGVSIGDSSRVMAFSHYGIIIGAGSTIRESAWIQCSSSPVNPGVGIQIGANTYLGPGSILGAGGALSIGADCQIGAGFTAIAENHVVGEDGASNSEVVRKGISVGDKCWIGHRVTLLDGVTLGDKCVVGAGAVVTRSFPSGSTIVGVPGKAVASRLVDK